MPESEYRFTRNKEETEVLQEKLFIDLKIDPSNPYTQLITRVIRSHFIMLDTHSGQSFHLMMNMNGPEDGMCLIQEPKTFDETKNFFQTLANDRKTQTHFYYRASIYTVNPSTN